MFRVAVFVVILGIIGGHYGNIRVGEGQCHGDLEGLIKNCAAYVQKPGEMTDPSEACCKVIKGTDVVCMCKHLTPEQQQLLSAVKVIHCLQFCGKPLAPGIKCGS